MRNALLTALAAALFLATPAHAQDAVEAGFTPERFRSHVSFLADDLLEGRNAGERGYDIAALYVAARFEELGLRQTKGQSWFQQVPLVEYGLKDGAATLIVGERRFDHGGSVLVSANPVASKQTIDAPAVFAGYGLDAPEQKLNDYAGLDVKGKIVVVLDGMPDGLPSDVAAHLRSEKSKMAERHGAIGLVAVRPLSVAKQRPWSRMLEGSRSKSMSWAGPDGKAFAEAPRIGFRAILDTEAASALFQGAPRSLDAVLKEADRKGAKPKGFALKQHLGFEQTNDVRTLQSPNVVAMLPGSDPALANEYVLLMAHLDHIGTNDQLTGDKIRNGAMDNATGIATLIEVARAMTASGQRPRRPILFAAVTAEEKGLLGSDYLARNPVVDGRIVGVVNLDMPVLLYDFTDVIAFGAEHSTLGPVVARAAAKMNVALAPDPLPEEGLFTRSDHYMMVRQGIPSVFLMTGFGGEGAKKFGEFLSTHYHRPSDQIDLPFNWNAAAKFARLNYLISREIADSDQAPLWYSDSFFGTRLAPNAEKATPPAR